ncbi:hypothetical protein ES705_32827 [subsurface metagenome]
MSQAVGALDITLVCGAATLGEKQYHFITLFTDGTAIVCGAGGVAIGILQNTPGIGEAARVRVLGTSKLVMNEAVDEAEAITSTATGAGEVVDGVDEYAGAIDIEAATAPNDIVEVLITHMYSPVSHAT